MTVEPPAHSLSTSDRRNVVALPIPARSSDTAAVWRGPGVVRAAPEASALTPNERVAWSHRWAWRGAYRLRSGHNVERGYRLLGRAVMAGLVHIIGRERAALYFMALAAEAGLCDGGNDNGPRAA